VADDISDKQKDIMISSGTILMAKDALRPECFQVEQEAYPNAWISVAHHLNSRELEKELGTAGWTFFYMASAISAMAFGFDRRKTILTAVARLVTNVKLQHCNCLVIDGVADHSFLGMPYFTVTAHARHIQKGTVFSRHLSELEPTLMHQHSNIHAEKAEATPK
jgi:hypothetical protein